MRPAAVEPPWTRPRSKQRLKLFRHISPGTLLLTLTTFLWGTTFVVVKTTLPGFPASELVLGRFLLAGLVFAPFLRSGKKLWLAATELGVLLWAGFATQTIGLNYTTVNRSAFITSLHVIFVPVFAGLLGRSTRPVVWLAAVTAAVGVLLLSYDRIAPNRGDLWTLACAITWAIYITRLEAFTRALPSRALTAAHLWVVVIISAMWTVHTGVSHQPIPWPAIIYLGLFATAATTWFQTLGQKWVPASQAAVLYTMEPLWAAVFGWIFLQEIPGVRGWAGGGMILLAALLTQLPSATTERWKRSRV